MFSHVCSRRLSLMLAIALMLVFCTPTLAEQRTVYAAVDDAIVYDIDGNTVATVPVNTALKLIGVKRGVCRVKLNGYTGYMNKSDLSSNPVTVTGSLTSMTVYVARDGAPLYDAGRKVIAYIPEMVEPELMYKLFDAVVVICHRPCCSRISSVVWLLMSSRLHSSSCTILFTSPS